MLSLCRYRIDHLAGVGYGGQRIVERGHRLASDNVVVTSYNRDSPSVPLRFDRSMTIRRPYDEKLTCSFSSSLRMFRSSRT